MTSHVAALLVDPRHFGFNTETARSNALQRPPADAERAVHIADLARAECAALAKALRAAGVPTIVAADADEPLPDAVFPNNWLSTHEDGTVVTYPMASPLRRLEKTELHPARSNGCLGGHKPSLIARSLAVVIPPGSLSLARSRHAIYSGQKSG